MLTSNFFRKRLMERIEEKVPMNNLSDISSTSSNLFNHHQKYVISPLINLNLIKIHFLNQLYPRLNFNHFYSIIFRPTTLFQHSSSAIAKQITYLDSELFHKIEPAEMLWWAKEQDPKKSPNVVLFTEHFNKISYWVRSNVLKPNEQKEREKYFQRFIKIMKVSLKIEHNHKY